MEFSQVMGFLNILNESIKLLPKNWKLMALIAAFFLLLPSILFLLLICAVRLLLADVSDSFQKPRQMLTCWALLLIGEIAFLISYLIISHFSGIATILVSAASYSGKKLSTNDFFSSIKTTWRNALTTTFHVYRHSSRYVLFVVVLASFLVSIYPNFITISVAIVLGITVFVFQLYSGVVWTLSIVVSVVEESCHGTEAVEKASEISQGHYMHGFMLNLFFNLLVLAISLVYYIGLDEYIWSLHNLTIYGSLFVNFLSMLRIFILMTYTVLYFKCKEHHGEEIGVLGNLQYTKLPTTTLNDE